jgi:cellulose synthase (UDP-forming)
VHRFFRLTLLWWCRFQTSLIHKGVGERGFLYLLGQITTTGVSGEFPTVQVLFEQVTLSQERRLVEMLFCRPGQWKHQETPGELQSLWLLLRILFRPRVLFGRNQKASAIAVSQV